MIVIEKWTHKKYSYRIEKRKNIGLSKDILSIVVALLFSIAVAGVLITFTGANAKMILWSIVKGSFGSRNAIIDTLVKATPILMTGLATIVPYRANIFNIGQEGQLYAGAITVTFVVFTFSHFNLPPSLYLPLLLVTAMMGGAVWSGIAGVLKANFDVNEIIVTVMLNYVILYFCNFLLGGVWQEPGNYYYNSVRFPDSTYLPNLFGTRLNIGFIIALLLVFIIHFLLWKTKPGYEIRAIGLNPIASLYKGIDTKRITLLVMLLSGAIAGLAGGIQVLGIQHRLLYGFSEDYGFTGILIALLGRLNPFGVALAAIFFGALQNGSSALLVYSNVPRELVTVIIGLMIISLLLCEALFKYQIRRVDYGE